MKYRKKICFTILQRQCLVCSIITYIYDRLYDIYIETIIDTWYCRNKDNLALVQHYRLNKEC